MMKKRTNQIDNNLDLSDWLEPLRRHSWEMEFLLTGFVLIGLLQIPEALQLLEQSLRMKIAGGDVFKTLLITLPIRVLLVGVKIMTINLILLLLLRGFWIGIIGLSSAFPDGIDYKNLSFNEKFTSFIKKRSIDSEYIIIRLDNICSSIFALSFLIFFITISIALFVIQIQTLTSLNNWFSIQAESNILYLFLNILTAVIGLFYLFAGFFKLIDFLSVGFFKRIQKKWFVKAYFMISRFISIVTLAFLYRPIYYYLVSNYRKKIITVILLFYMLITIGMFFGFNYNSQIYYPQTNYSQYYLNSNEYQNISDDIKENRIISSPMIQSDVIKDDYLKLFIPYDPDIHKKIESLCPELVPVSQLVKAYSIDWGYSVKKSSIKKALKCFSKFYNISIDDSVYSDIKTLFHMHPNHNEKGIMMYIPVKNLESGYHMLEIMEVDQVTVNIHFWKY